MGLFCYPILMAADILMFNAHKIPVGRDQVQHVEMARDIAQRFNMLFGQGKELFTLPEAQIEEAVATLPGLDGRKMSKSYDNTIPLFSSEKQLKEAILKIVTDSKQPGEAKDPDNSHLFTIYKAFATPEQTNTFYNELKDGLAWGEAKQQLFTVINTELAEPREHYQELIAQPEKIEEILQAGAAKARKLAMPFLQELRESVGLRSFNQQLSTTKKEKKKSAKTARFVSFREKDGNFHFRLMAANGEELLLSKGFANPKEIGELTNQLINNPEQIGIIQQGLQLIIYWDNERIANSVEYSTDAELANTVQEIKQALQELAEQE